MPECIGRRWLRWLPCEPLLLAWDIRPLLVALRMGLLAPKMKTQPRKGLWVHPSCVEEAGRAQDTRKERGICWTWTQMMTRELGLGTAASDVFRGSQEGYRGDNAGLAKCLLSEPVWVHHAGILRLGVLCGCAKCCRENEAAVWGRGEF